MICNKEGYEGGGWTDCTKSGQSYGTAKYKIIGKTLFVRCFKNAASGTLSGWTVIGNVPSGYVGMDSGEEVMACAYHNGTGYINFALGADGTVSVIGTLNSIPYMFAVPFGT